MIRLILVVLVAGLFGQLETLTSSCTVFAQTGCKPCYRPDPDANKKVENKAPDVTDVALDRTELKLPPPKPGDPPKHPDYSNGMLVSVVTTASDAEGDTLTYNYTVSGGRIIGAGTKVIWDLNGVRAGTYTITAGVDDGCGVCGKTATRTVTVIENESTPACVCSEIQIDAPYLKKRNSGRYFVVHLTGPKRTGLTYQWTISEGSILSGQGTNTITSSRPDEKIESPVTVAVEISGLDEGCGCPMKATRTFGN